MSDAPALLEARGLSKFYPGVKALDGVDFTLRAGEVHALLGENGAGKSTLIGIVSGAIRADAGVVRLNGKAFEAHSPADAERAGIAAVYQEAPAPLNLSVAENIFIGRFPTRWGLVRQGEIQARARHLASAFGLDIDVSRPLGSYALAIRQLVAVARAIDLNARVLVLDEPTASLDAAEVDKLFAIMRTLTAKGMGLVFVTHFLDQVYAIADRITVLRNGRIAGERVADELPKGELVRLMLGRDIEAAAARPAQAASPASVPASIRFKGLARKGIVAPFDLAFAPGEIVGAAGLLGSGRSETALLMFGALRTDAGAIEIQCEKVRVASPRDAIARRLALLPENRKTEGIVGALSVRENIILALQARRGWLRPLSRRAQNELADRFIRLLDIRTPDAEKPIEQLSGGNQQKALLARWLATEPLLMMLDEPTHGIDVGAHAEILNLIDGLRAQGMAVYVISSEIDELIALAGRVSVMRDRRQVRMLGAKEVSSAAILSAIAESEAAP